MLNLVPGPGMVAPCSAYSLLGSDSCEPPLSPNLFEFEHSEVDVLVLRHSAALLCPEKGLQVALRLSLHVAP